jgi:hypothetical protein
MTYFLKNKTDYIEFKVHSKKLFFFLIYKQKTKTYEG